MKTVELQEVVVKSFKNGADFGSAPVSASVVASVELHNRQATTTKDLALFTPNLFVPDYGSRLTSPVYIRGVGSKINSPSVGLYVDGIPYFEKSAFDFDLNEIETVEILRGPQGTLYGRNTMGGLVNIVSKSPLKLRATSVGVSCGNYGFLKGQFAHYGGNADNTFGFTVSGNASHCDGFFTNLFTEQKTDPVNSGSGRIRLDWRLNPSLTLRFASSTDYLNQGGYPYALMDANGKTGDVDYNAYSSYGRRISSNGLSIVYSGNRFSLNSQTSFQYLSDDQRIDQDFSVQDTYFAIQQQTQAAFSQEINIKSVNSGMYKWLFGAFAFYQDIDNEVVLEYRKSNYSTDKIYKTPTAGVSLYHQSVVENLLFERLSLTLGVRFDYERASDDYTAYRDTTDRRDKTDAFFSRLNFSQVTPKIAVQYILPNTQTLYFSITKGYKTGGFNTSFQRDEDRSFAPEYSWNYELGTKARLLDNLLQIEGCLFFIDWRNQQIYQPMPGGIGQMMKNAGRSESKGAELSLRINPLKDLKIQADWGFTRAVFKEYQRNDTTDYAGNYIPFAPRQTVSLGFDYKIPVLKKVFDRLTVNMNYQGIDRLYWSEDNAVSQPYYGLLNGKLTARKGNLSISLWAKNLTGAEYSAYYFESLGKRFAQRGKPFTAGFTVSVALN